MIGWLPIDVQLKHLLQPLLRPTPVGRAQFYSDAMVGARRASDSVAKFLFESSYI